MHRLALSILIFTTTALATGFVVFGAPSWIRIPLVLAFALVVPGWGWARRLRLADAGDTLLAAVTISVGLLVVVGEGMALLRLWSVQGGFLVLAAIAVLGITLPGAGNASPTPTVRHRPRLALSMRSPVVAREAHARELPSAGRRPNLDVVDRQRRRKLR